MNTDCPDYALMVTTLFLKLHNSNPIFHNHRKFEEF